MELADMVALLLPLILVVVLGWYFSIFMYRVFHDESSLPRRMMKPVDRLFFKLIGVDPTREMSWKHYAISLMAFNALGWIVIYSVQRMQHWLPFNPDNLPAVPAWLAFNTAHSFVSNTNWQAYSGEATLSYFSQMIGLTTQNFVSAATGLTVALALARGFSRTGARTIGNFWVDLYRSTMYVLLPISFVVALALVATGVPQTMDSAVEATSVTGQAIEQPVGPVASQIAIKQLGTNGGGFYGVNSAHPLENPTGLSNLIETVSILLIPVAVVFLFGRMVGNSKQGIALFAAMLVIMVPLLIVEPVVERDVSPTYQEMSISADASDSSGGGNMEGKEQRFGIGATSTWAVFTTSASNGSVNGMMDSMTPIGGMIPMALMATGEVVFGGVGSGLYGMIFYAILAMFVAGLMVGRTPEYLRKKLEVYEMKMAMLALLVVPALILGGVAISVVLPATIDSLTNESTHGLSGIIYAFTSAGANNGSAFASLAVNTPWFNGALGVAMFIGRFFMIIPALAIAGSLASKSQTAVTTGTMPTTGPLWVGLLVGCVLIVGGLTFLPIFSLGPVFEALEFGSGVLAGQQ